MVYFKKWLTVRSVELINILFSVIKEDGAVEVKGKPFGLPF